MSTYTFMGREIVDLEIEDIDTSDAPDFCDAYVSFAVWKDTGKALTDEELEAFNDTCGDQVYDAVIDYLY